MPLQGCRSATFLRVLEAPSAASNAVKSLGFAVLEAVLEAAPTPPIHEGISCSRNIEILEARLKG